MNTMHHDKHTAVTVKGIFRETYDMMKPKMWHIVGRFALVLLLLALIDLVSGNNIAMSILVSLVFTFITAIMSLTYVETGDFSFHAEARKITIEQFGFFAGAFLLVKLVVIAGYFLLIIPGIIAGLAFFPVKYIAIKEHIMPLAALKKGALMTHGHRLKILEIIFFLVLLNILGAVCLIAGLLITIPFTLLCGAILFKKLEAMPQRVAITAPSAAHVVEAAEVS